MSEGTEIALGLISVIIAIGVLVWIDWDMS